MKNIKKSVYIFELIILAFIIIYNFVVLKKFGAYADTVNLAFWIVITLIMLIKYRFPKDKNYYKGSAIRIVIISLLLYLIVIYSIGLFSGFNNFVYSHSIIYILKNIIPIIFVVLSKTIVRYLISKNSVANIRPMILLTILFIILDITVAANYYSFYNGEQIFIFICLVCLPYIARESLDSYIVYKVSYVPSLILQLSYNLYPYVLPFFPDLGDYITSLLGVLFPFFIYKSIEKTIERENKHRVLIIKMSNKLVVTFVILVLAVNAALISGLFSYKMIAIASNSMVPEYGRGDAIIYQKIEDNELENLHKGNIIVFDENGTIMTHRIVNIKEGEDGYYYKTKGDNNNAEDDFTVSDYNVIGVVKYVVPMAGYPTIWVGEFLQKLGETI